MIDCSSPGYYTPDISQFCVGFEFEYNHSLGYKESFEPVVIGIKDKNGNYSHQLSEIVDSLDDGHAGARVPFLTADQLLAEFAYPDRRSSLGTHLHSKGVMITIHVGPISLSYDFNTRKLVVGVYRKGDVLGLNPIFTGRVRCINELREVKRLLQIEVLVGSVHSSQIENI